MSKLLLNTLSFNLKNNAFCCREVSIVLFHAYNTKTLRLWILFLLDYFTVKGNRIKFRLEKQSVAMLQSLWGKTNFARPSPTFYKLKILPEINSI